MNKVHVNFLAGDIPLTHYEDVKGYTVEPELDNHDNHTGVYQLYLLVPAEEGFTYVRVMNCKDKDVLTNIGNQIIKGIHWKPKK